MCAICDLLATLGQVMQTLHFRLHVLHIHTTPLIGHTHTHTHTLSLSVSLFLSLSLSLSSLSLSLFFSLSSGRAPVDSAQDLLGRVAN